MRLTALALTTSLLAGLLATPLSAQDDPVQAAAARRRVAAVAAAQGDQSASLKVPRHPAASSPAEARAQARRLAEYKGWQERMLQQQHSERARVAHARRAAAARRQAAGAGEAEQGAVALERMNRMQRQQEQASKAPSARAPRHAATRASNPRNAVGHRKIQQRQEVRQVNPKSATRSARPGGR